MRERPLFFKTKPGRQSFVLYKGGVLELLAVGALLRSFEQQLPRRYSLPCLKYSSAQFAAVMLAELT